jgi:hypothetical protein
MMRSSSSPQPVWPGLIQAQRWACSTEQKSLSSDEEFSAARISRAQKLDALLATNS